MSQFIRCHLEYDSTSSFVASVTDAAIAGSAGRERGGPGGGEEPERGNGTNDHAVVCIPAFR